MRKRSVVGGKTLADAFDRYILEVSVKKEGNKWESMRLSAMKKYFGLTFTLGEIKAPNIAAWRD